MMSASFRHDITGSCSLGIVDKCVVRTTHTCLLDYVLLIDHDARSTSHITWG